MNDHATLTGAVATASPAVTVPSADDVATVSRLFSELFAIQAGADDDFFELGGDSLAGETLLAAIEQEFSVTLPLSILLDTSTPRSVAGAIAAGRKRSMPSSLIPVRSKGAGAALFCIHGFNGEATFPKKLAAIVPERPVYALRAIGLLDGEAPFLSADRMAAHYIAAMRSVQPSGPYLLFGHCGPSVIAYEMAQQLSAAGQKVAGLILVDPAVGSRSRWLTESGLMLRFHQMRYRRHGRRILKEMETLPGHKGGARRELVRRAMNAIVSGYVPKPYAGPVLMVCSSKRRPVLLDPVRGYPSVIRDLQSVVVEGAHKAVFAGMTKESPGPLAVAVISFVNRTAPL